MYYTFHAFSMTGLILLLWAPLPKLWCWGVCAEPHPHGTFGSLWQWCRWPGRVTRVFTRWFTLLSFLSRARSLSWLWKYQCLQLRLGTELKQAGGLVSRGQDISSHGAERAATGNCTRSSTYFADTSSWLIVYNQKEQVYLLFFEKTKGYGLLK